MQNRLEGASDVEVLYAVVNSVVHHILLNTVNYA